MVEKNFFFLHFFPFIITFYKRYYIGKEKKKSVILQPCNEAKIQQPNIQKDSDSFLELAKGYK